MSDELTRPERYVEIAQARETAKRIKQAAGCTLCVHRAWTFGGRGFCKITSQTFPRCLEQGGSVTYTPDFAALKRRAA